MHGAEALNADRSATPSDVVHGTLACGVEYVVEHWPDRPVAAMELRVLAGFADEPDTCLGLTHLIQELLEKGTARRTGRELLDAFDAIGARHDAWTGRECIGFACLTLPEYVDEALALYAEMFREPTFPEDAFEVAVDLARLQIQSLEDEPRELADKILTRQAYGPRLGRHPLGEPDTLERITRDTLVEHWRQWFQGGRIQIGLAGPIDADRLAARVEALFGGFGSPEPQGRRPWPIEFSPGYRHEQRDLEQEQIALCWPGAPYGSDDYFIERVLLGVLSDGMSSRLFTEVREKQGLVYAIDAWHEHPRSGGMIHVAASSTPANCDRTLRTILREIDRVQEDLTDDEIARAVHAIVARTETRADITRTRCAEVAADLFRLGRVIPTQEKLDRVQQVGVADVRDYLQRHPRDALCIVTLGPRPLEGGLPEAATHHATDPTASP